MYDALGFKIETKQIIKKKKKKKRKIFIPTRLSAREEGGLLPIYRSENFLQEKN